MHDKIGNGAAMQKETTASITNSFDNKCHNVNVGVGKGICRRRKGRSPRKVV
jgi:hypothetical protein